MTAALAEPIATITTTTTGPSTARAEASRANGRRSRGPVTPEGKARSRRNGCRDGLTGKGVVLPPEAEREVDRREAEFARDFRPRNAVERELVRQIALGAWRREVLSIRIVQHDARMNAARFANWEQDELLKAAGRGRMLGDDPERAVIRLRRSSVGCDWLIERWRLLGNGLSSAAEGGPVCAWTDADLALALDLLGLPAGLRHLDDRARQLESLRAEARSGSDEAVAGLRELIAEEVAELEERGEEAWGGIERPMLEDWRSGVDMDLGPEGTRLRRYEAAANRLFWSAWAKLERLRKERREPLIPRRERQPVSEPAPRPPAAAPRPPAPARPLPEPSRSSLLGDPAGPVLDFWAGGAPRPGLGAANPPRDKTNPAPARPAHGATPPKAGFPPAAGRRNVL